jgi:hypothetical protein
MLTAKQDNRLTAAENLFVALKKDPTPYQADKALQAIVQQLDAFITRLKPLREQAQRNNNGGPSTGKSAARLHLATVTAEVAGDVFAYASKNQLPIIQALADYNEGQLRNLRGSRLTDVATAIFNELPNHQPQLGQDYALDAARSLEFEDAIAAYDKQKTKPRQSIVEGQAARTSLRTEFSTLSTLLKDQFARGMRKYKRSNKEFYDRIIGAREVIDRPGSHPKSAAVPAT